MKQDEIDDEIKLFIGQLDALIEENHPTDKVPFFQMKLQLLTSLKETIPYRNYNEDNWS